MYSRSIIPDEFNAPTEYITEKFVLRPLTIEYVNEDYEVVMSSVDHLYKLMDNNHIFYFDSKGSIIRYNKDMIYFCC